jgi:hypothetical protein
MTFNFPPALGAIVADLYPFAPLGKSQPSPVSALRVACSTLPGTGIRLAYMLKGKIEALRLPITGAPKAMWNKSARVDSFGFEMRCEEQSATISNGIASTCNEAACLRSKGDNRDGRAQRCPNPWPLWRHTCFEAFLSVPGQERYQEYNFSPAGLWAAGAFRRYREIECDLKNNGASPPAIETEWRGDALVLTAQLPFALLPGASTLRVGLSAVIEHGDGRIEYWALHHPVAQRADFHHPSGWVLYLDTEAIQL